jgi:hypothetical protein
MIHGDGIEVIIVGGLLNVQRIKYPSSVTGTNWSIYDV